MQHSSLSIEARDTLYQKIINEFDAERSLKNCKGALRVIKRAVNLRPTYFMVYYKLALLYKQMGDNLKLMNALQTAIWYCSTCNESTSFENIYWLNILRGFHSTCKKNHAEAELHYKSAIAIYPNRMEAHFRFALALGSQGLYEQAIPVFHEAKKCVEQEMETTDREKIMSCESFSDKYKLALCVENIGWCHAHLEKHDDALIHYTEALNIYPEFVLFHENRYFSNKTKGNHKEAISDCENALLLTSDTATKAKLLSMIASVHVLQNQHDNAREIYKHAIKLNPSSHTAYFDITNLAPYTTDNRLTIELVNKALEHVVEPMGRYWLLYRRSNAFTFLGKNNESNSDKRLMKAITRLKIERVD
jgi:tetratricopeptide (TPR) repeat protein